MKESRTSAGVSQLIIYDDSNDLSTRLRAGHTQSRYQSPAQNREILHDNNSVSTILSHAEVGGQSASLASNLNTLVGAVFQSG